MIDLVKSDDCAIASILKEELEELTAYMKDHLKIETVQLGELLDNLLNKLEIFLSINDYESISSSDSDKYTFSNQKVSPKKRKHHQNNKYVK